MLDIWFMPHIIVSTLISQLFCCSVTNATAWTRKEAAVTESGELSRCGPGAKGCFISKGGNSNLIEGNIYGDVRMKTFYGPSGKLRAALSAGVVFQT